MPDKSKRISIPLDEGIFSFGNLYEIGPRPRETFRYIRKYIPQDGRSVGFSGQNWAPFEAGSSPVDFATCDSITAAERFESPYFGVSEDSGFLFGGRSTVNTCTLWDETGTVVDILGTVGDYKSIVRWNGLATPTTFCANGKGVMRKTVDRATFSDYTPTGVTFVGGIGPAEQLAVYQNRLWISVSNKLYYTDVLDSTNIRQYGQVNPFVFPMQIMALERVGISDVDPGAQNHFLVFGQHEIWALDGAPGQGNEVVRRYTYQHGVRSQNHVVPTEYGTVFYGTDRQLYLVPPGATQNPVAIGDGIRDFFLSDNILLVWRKPYLAIIVGGIYNIAYIELSSGKLKYWGRMSLGMSSDPLGGIVSRYPRNNYFDLAYKSGSTCSHVRFGDYNRTDAQIIKTGYISEPGYEVEIKKIILTALRDSADKSFSVLIRNNEDQVEAFTFAVPATTTVPIGKTTIASRAPITKNCRGLGVSIEFSILQAPYDQMCMAAVQSLEIEYDVVPRKTK